MLNVEYSSCQGPISAENRDFVIGERGLYSISLYPSNSKPNLNYVYEFDKYIYSISLDRCVMTGSVNSRRVHDIFDFLTITKLI